MLIPYLARHFRVVTYDPVGNGRSDRPTDSSRFRLSELVEDAIAVLDATETRTCIPVGLSYGGGLVTVFTALHPDRVDAVIPIAPSHAWGVFLDDPQDPNWAMYDPAYWWKDWPGFVNWFFDLACSDPHSTKAWDDTVRWANETTGETIALASEAGPSFDLDMLEAKVRAIDVPMLIIHGTDDRIIGYEGSLTLQKMVPQAELLTIEGAGHIPTGRYGVRVNHAIRDFVDRTQARSRPDATWHVGIGRTPKALYVSSPIGLGHARRDVAIASELRSMRPDLQIEWLAQNPVTRVLDAAGEAIHPASRLLANESAHIESESGEHDLHAFEALRNMDEIQMANFLLTEEIIVEGQYDLVIGDEAWEVDFQLHENPDLKKAPFAWMTDFVGYLPMPSGGERGAFVAADYNAEMIEQVSRYRRVRDRSIFVGNPDDIVDTTFGPNLPGIREWTVDNFDFAGYVTGFDPSTLGDRAELRAELGYHQDERVCIVTVGGSGVGTDLIRRVIAAQEAASRSISDLRMIVVTGPRIDPSSLPDVNGVEYLPYVDRLYLHLAVADLAIVQGGLTTTMELTAAKVPFIYVPLRNHFEQNIHVRTRLDRYGAGRFMAYEDLDPENLATIMAEEIGSPVAYLDVETDGATRAATMIASLI